MRLAFVVMAAAAPCGLGGKSFFFHFNGRISGDPWFDGTFSHLRQLKYKLKVVKQLSWMCWNNESVLTGGGSWRVVAA